MKNISIIALVLLTACTCTDTDVMLEGELITIQDKYEIPAIRTDSGDYWIYDEIDMDYINQTVKIEAKLSPVECSICSRRCDVCQCPNRELLHSVRIIS